MQHNYIPMLEFFGRKHFLADHLENFVDIHNHLLPGIDDGAKDEAASIALVKEFNALGIRKFISTPHILKPLYPNTPETIREAHQRLLDEMLDQELTNISIETAAEHMIDVNFEPMLDENEFMPLKGSYLLIETSFMQAPLNFDQAVIAINKKRLTPILAHPERYFYLHQRPGMYKKYQDQGILFQLNLLSLAGYYDKEVQRMGWKLLDQGMIDFLGTDIHNLHQCKVLKELALPRKRIEQLIPLIQRSIETFY